MVSGDDCETDYDTDAKFCVTLDDASLDCDKNYEGYFSSCEVEVDYTVETDLENDNKYLDVEVECEAEISYERKDGFGSYDSEDDDESHTLYSSGSETGEIELDFDFSYYEQVYSVRIDDAECEIDSFIALNSLSVHPNNIIPTHPPMAHARGGVTMCNRSKCTDKRYM